MRRPDNGVHPLASVPLFANLPARVLDELAEATIVRDYPQGQVLCHERDAGDHLIVLEAGQLRVSRYTSAGTEAVLTVVEPPAALGELALLDGAPRSATITAQRAVRVRLVPRQVFLDLLRREPAVAEGLLRTLAEMVRAANERHEDMIGLDVPGRLAKWLLRKAGQRDGLGDVGAGTVIVIERSQGELAAELGTTRPTLNRALHDLADLGIVAIDGHRVTIHKPAALRRYLE